MLTNYGIRAKREISKSAASCLSRAALLWEENGRLARRLKGLSNRTVFIISLAVWVGVVGIERLGWKYSLDLQVYRGAGMALYQGNNPFQQLFTVHQLPFTYPPFAVLLLSPISLGPLHLVESMWLLASCAALVAICYIGLSATWDAPRSKMRAGAILWGGVAYVVLEPVRSNLNYGQINSFLLLLVLSDVLHNRTRLRGVPTGLAAAIKLTPLIFAIYFLVARDSRSLIRFGISFASLSALGFSVLPDASFKYWTSQIFDPGRTGNVAGVANLSLNGLFHRSPFPTNLSGSLWTCAAIGILILCWRLLKEMQIKDHALYAVVVLAIGGNLISPISWSHHWMWVVLLPMIALADGPLTSLVRGILSVLLCIVVVAPYSWHSNGAIGVLEADSLPAFGVLVLITWYVSLRSGRTVVSHKTGEIRSKQLL